MIVCSAPGCQTTAGCRCNERSNVIILPVIRRLNCGSVITRNMTLDWPIDDKLRVAAKQARCSPEQLIEALVVYGLAAIEKKPVEAFILAAEVEAAKARDFR